MSQFTVTNLNLAKDQSKPTKAFADVVAGGIVHKGVRVVTGPKGFFISMSSAMRVTPELDKDDQPVKDTNGKIVYIPVLDENDKPIYDDHYFPVDEQTRNNMTAAVLAAYNAKIESAKAQNSAK